MSFAKIFEHPIIGQVIVHKCDSDGSPAISIIIEAPETVVVDTANTVLIYKNVKGRNEGFEKITEEIAFGAAEELLANMFDFILTDKVNE